MFFYFIDTTSFFIVKLCCTKENTMKSSKCTSCGANIEAYKHNGTFACPYCGTVYSQKPPIQQTTQTNNNQGFQQNVETPKQEIPERPKISIFWLFILFYCGFFPALFYIMVIRHQQREWDKKYNKY